MDTHTPDDVLVAAFINGDNAAFGILSERYRRKLIAQAYLFFKDRDIAQDVVQDSLLQILKALQRGSYKEIGKFSSWVFINNKRNCIREKLQISTRNSILGKLHKNGTILKNFNAMETGFHVDPETLFLEKEVRKALYATINVLDPQFRESLLLRNLHDLKYEEIAKKTGANINTIRTRLRLGSKKVIAYMQKADL